MQYFMEDDIPVLPIHDSFIIRAGFNQYLRKAMQTAFQKRFDGIFEDGPRLPEHFSMTDEEFDKEVWKDKYFRVNVEDMFSDKCSIMENYLDKWRIFSSKPLAMFLIIWNAHVLRQFFCPIQMNHQ